ncbi:hypothetical protein FPOA_10670 [Fusarium poae]|uniref:Protein kinase domain-containing protein n=1 Tax=Fusarium poae TaxID=36050 RepID=A0A1B8AEN1_FUSPO|nr:hypothetical protein FPOA_10670 [Fusarium poae]
MGCCISTLRPIAQSDKVPDVDSQLREEPKNSRLIHKSQMAEQSGSSTSESDVNWGRMVRDGKLQNKFGHDFLPADKIDQYSTSEIIMSVLKKDDRLESQIRELEEYIRVRPARLSFLLLVSIYRVPWIKTLADPKYDFGDDDLPNFIMVDDSPVLRRNQKDIAILFCESDVPRDDDGNDIRLFRHERWSFLAPVFTTANFYQELDDSVPLPFLDVPGTPTKTGSFGTVHKVELHHAHQLGIIPSNGRNILVALKTINNLPQDNWFIREMKVLQRIQIIVRESPGLHLITPIASYKLKKDTGGCILFPWAEGGNLKDFWDRNDNKAGVLQQKSRTTGLSKMIWTLKQMQGLCKALVELHRPHTAEGALKSNEDDPHFRHGDLKPENILVFQEGTTEILRIADLGLGRFHLKSTDGRRKAKEYTKTVTGTTRYMPPEFNDDNHISRKLDVWSLGCLFIEFIIWAAWGLEGLDQFNKLDNDEFWQKRSNSRNVVHDNISSWMQSMRKVLSPRTALGDILRLVSSDMLKRLDERCSSQEIYTKLEKTVRNALEDEDYCLDWDHKANISNHTLPNGGSFVG